jgi:hypothetical protein
MTRTFHAAAAHGRDIRPFRPDPARPNRHLPLTSEDSARFIEWVKRYGTSSGYLKNLPPGSYLREKYGYQPGA